MDDIHLDDPRKFSAKQIKAAKLKAGDRRSLWQYLFDLLVKTLICATLIALDFTLFANSGSYNLFSSGMLPNMEVEFIYVGILGLSFVLMFIASFFRWLENMVLAACFALMTVAIVNQFAVFEKKSVLLVLFNGVFSDTINMMLYEYALWIVGGLAYILFWIVLKILSRSFLFYFMLLLLALLGWILSESYLNTSLQYFRTTGSAPTLRSETAGDNLVFLSFNSLTSPNNLKNMYQTSKQHMNIMGSFNNALGFYSSNNFTLYPNALVQNPQQPFMNLIAAYNPDSGEDVSTHLMSSVVRNQYFDFKTLQKDRLYLKDSSLYDMLRKDKYTIHVYQTRDVDTCYLDNKLVTSDCKEKINTPISFANTQFNVMEKTVLLVGQWLNSTGFVPSLNPLLKMVEYVFYHPALKPLGFDINNLYALNSFKVLDLIAEKMDQQNGKQAYFAVIDLPSETYIYDEFCQLKPMSDWVSEETQPFYRVSVDNRRSSYADQVSCLYGYLEKFMRQLEGKGLLEDTTIVIEGLNVPLQLTKMQRDYYRQLQETAQVTLAIRPANAKKANFDYSVCSVDEILNSYFFTHKSCTEFGQLKTTDKNMAQIKKMIEEDKYKNHMITTAQNSFRQWFSAWVAHNNFAVKFAPKAPADGALPIVSDEAASVKQPEKNMPIKVVEKPKIAEVVVEDIPEEKLKSISVMVEEVAKMEEQKPEIQKDSGSKGEPKEKELVAPENEPQNSFFAIDENTPAETLAEDVKSEPAVDEVVPETLFEEIKPEDNTHQQKLEETVAKAKEAVKAKTEQRIRQNREAKKELNALVRSIDTLNVSEEYKDVLQAPVAEGQNLSPEELKKQYHQTLQKAAEKADKQVNIEVKVIEN